MAKCLHQWDFIRSISKGDVLNRKKSNFSGVKVCYSCQGQRAAVAGSPRQLLFKDIYKYEAQVPKTHLEIPGRKKLSEMLKLDVTNPSSVGTGTC